MRPRGAERHVDGLCVHWSTQFAIEAHEYPKLQLNQSCAAIGVANRAQRASESAVEPVEHAFGKNRNRFAI